MCKFRFSLIELMLLVPLVAVSCVTVHWFWRLWPAVPLTGEARPTFIAFAVLAVAGIVGLTIAGVLDGVKGSAVGFRSYTRRSLICAAVILPSAIAFFLIRGFHRRDFVPFAFAWALATMLAWVQLFSGVAALFRFETRQMARGVIASSSFAVGLSVSLANWV